jgi:hypothetical protein
MNQVLGLTKSSRPALKPTRFSPDSTMAAVPLPLAISPSSILALVFLASVPLKVISTSPPLSESLLSSLLEVDEELPLSRELRDPSKPEILPDSELDDDEEDAVAASTASSEVG